MAKAKAHPTCPCGPPASFERCCGRYLQGAEAAPGAETLMRSRYSAYALQHDRYLLDTWHRSTRPEALDPNEHVGIKWIGLQVLRASEHGDEASVEFVARYKIGGRAGKLHELSRFVREDGRWYYVDGQLHD
ncbi:YchJ family metal-binding protein [Chitinivorax sp. PXF-14]|uniref:YchJ family protein n=1 Tax=Chitinivorax sp. PXF-14 TaxID=3230488 RepID=UPI0034657090